MKLLHDEHSRLSQPRGLQGNNDIFCGEADFGVHCRAVGGVAIAAMAADQVAERAVAQAVVACLTVASR